MASRQLQTVMRHLRRLASPSDCRLSDRDLLERFVSQRDEEAFAALVQRHGPMVLGVCRRVLHNLQDAEDACQAALLVLARKAGSIRKRDCAGSWLYGVAYRIARNLSREIARRRVRERSVEELSHSDPAGDLSWREVRAALDAEIDRLPERYRAPLVLCYLEGKTRDEAAQHLGWTLGTLRGRLEKGRELLRSRLVRRGLTLGAALVGSTLLPQATAAVSPSLLTATIQAAKWTLTNPDLPSSFVSAQAAALTKGALKTMAITKIKIATGLLMAFGVVSGGAGALVRNSFADQPAQTQSGDPPTENENRPTKPPASRQQKRPEQASNAEPAPKTVAPQATLSGAAPVLTVAFSPDGKLLASGGFDGSLILWDVATKKEARSLRMGQGGKVHCVKFSPDGKTLAVGGSDHSVKILRVANGEELGVLIGHEDAVLSVAFSPDGKSLASGGADHALFLWQVVGGRIHWRYQLEGPAAAIAFAPDGRLVAAEEKDGTIRLLDATIGKEIPRTGFASPNSSSPHAAVAFSPDGKFLASPGADSDVILWEVTSGKELRRLMGRDGWIRSLAFSPDGRFLAAAGDQGLRLWELATAKEVIISERHKTIVNSVAFSPDGKLLGTGSDDHTIKLWNWKEGRTALPKAFIRGNAGAAFRSADASPVGGNRFEQLLDDLLKKEKNDQDSIEALYLATLARFPTELELKFVMEHLEKKADRRAALEDLLFALTNSKEFIAYVESLGKRHSPRQH